MTTMRPTDGAYLFAEIADIAHLGGVEITYFAWSSERADVIVEDDVQRVRLTGLLGAIEPAKNIVVGAADDTSYAVTISGVGR